jgi:heme exporter protein B
MFNRIFALLRKDILLELRQQHSFYGLILYLASTIFVLYLSLNQQLSGDVWNSMFWVIQLFVCVNTVAKSFIQESKGKMFYFYSISSPVEFIIAKQIFNSLLISIMSMLSLLLFFIFLDNPVVYVLRFTGIVLIGSISLSLVFTLMSAIAAKAQQNAALIPILGFPIILPLLLLLIRLSKTAFAEAFQEGAALQIAGFILVLDVLIVTLSIILFPFLWKD